MRKIVSTGVCLLGLLIGCSEDEPAVRGSLDSNVPASGGATGPAPGATGGSPANAAGGASSGGRLASGGSTAAGGNPPVSEGGTSAGIGAAAGGSAAPSTTGGTETGTASGGSPGAGGVTAGSPGQGGAPASAGEAMGGAPVAGMAGTGGAMGGRAASLKDKYASHFPIGAAVDSESTMTHAALLRQHFNSVTPENEMKFSSLQPSRGNFTYQAADRIVDFAVANGMKVRGHALVWHRQNPDWLFSNGAGGLVSRDELFARMKTHITNVMQRYRGKVYAWDVVNEAMRDDGTYRRGDEETEDQRSRWFEIAGESYIAEAFRYAHEADPDAKLFYNDYYNYIPAKHQGIHDMLKALLDAGVPVHGVGLQAHLSIETSTVMTSHGFHQTVENMEKAVELYASLGLEVQITELDMSLYIPGTMYTPETFYTAATFTDAVQAKQAARYAAFFELFRKHADVITNVTFWGIADDNTWLSEFTSGRKDFPLLFDDNHQPKPAYDAVVGF